MKCNRLIDRALSLETELREKDRQLLKLRETKKDLEAELAAMGIEDTGQGLSDEGETTAGRGTAEIPAEVLQQRTEAAQLPEGSGTGEGEQDTKKVSQQKIFDMLQSLSTHIRPPEIRKRQKKPKRHAKMSLYRDFRKKQELLEQEQSDRKEIGAEEEVVIIYEKSGISGKFGGIIRIAALFAVIGAAVCAAVICLM